MCDVKEVLNNDGDGIDDDGIFRKVFVEKTSLSSKAKPQVLGEGTNRIDGIN